MEPLLFKSGLNVQELSRHYVGCLRTFWAILNFKFDFLAFGEGFETTALNGAEMYEHVFATIVLTNEPKTFRFVKPLD